MSLDYRFAGSASYSRFCNELKNIVKLFGGKSLETEKDEKEREYAEIPLKYSFPVNLPEVFKKWANNPYDDFSVEETKEIGNFLFTKKEKVKKISEQIVYEFEQLIENNKQWYVW